MGLEAYSTRKLPEPKCITEIPAPRELLRLIAASLPLALVSARRAGVVVGDGESDGRILYRASQP
jgi:hypothetical protein